LVNAARAAGDLRWSPDGHVLRFTVGDPGKPTLSLWEVSADGGNLHRLLDGWRGAPTGWADGEASGDWTPDGKYFLFRSARAGRDSVWALREKTDALRGGSRNPLLLTTSDLGVEKVVSGKGGRVFFAGSKESRELARYDAHLKQFVPFLSGISTRSVSFSRDGQWVAYATAPGFTLWRSKLDGSARQQLTFPPFYAEGPQWSPDGKQIAFHSLIPGGLFTRIYTISSEGGTPEAITGEAYSALHAEWSPQGDSLLFGWSSIGLNGRGEQIAIYQVDLKTKQLSRLPGSEGCEAPALSPDGRHVAALADDGRKLVLFDFESERWTELAKGIGLFGAAWSADSKYVYSQEISGDSEQPIFRVRISDGKMERIATSNQILRPDVTRFSFLGLAPDGSPLVALTHSNSDIYALDVDFP
jgi:Tol biopolymer transport system component